METGTKNGNPAHHILEISEVFGILGHSTALIPNIFLFQDKTVMFLPSSHGFVSLVFLSGIRVRRREVEWFFWHGSCGDRQASCGGRWRWTLLIDMLSPGSVCFLLLPSTAHLCFWFKGKDLFVYILCVCGVSIAVDCNLCIKLYLFPFCLPNNWPKDLLNLSTSCKPRLGRFWAILSL